MPIFNINKTFDSSPSKNKVEEKGLSLEDAKIVLNGSAASWKKYGGIVRHKDETTLILEEANGREIITFTIVEAEDNS